MLLGISPKRLPIVSTGKSKKSVMIVTAIKAMMMPGTKVMGFQRRPNREVIFGQRIINAKVPKHVRLAAKLAVSAYLTNALICEKKSDGSLSICKPKASLICDKPINTAMPLVKPMMIATGIKRIKLPTLNSPMVTNNMPAKNVESIKLATPYRSTMAYTITTKAPAGPPICTLLPPNAEIKKPPITAEIKPASGLSPDAIAKAMARGKAITPTVIPLLKSLIKVWLS